MSDISSTGIAGVAPGYGKTCRRRSATRRSLKSPVMPGCGQDGHCHVRVVRLSDASRCPHELHVFELGYQRSITISRRPALAALYPSICRKVPHPAVGDGPGTQPPVAPGPKDRLTGSFSAWV